MIETKPNIRLNLSGKRLRTFLALCIGAIEILFTNRTSLYFNRK